MEAEAAEKRKRMEPQMNTDEHGPVRRSLGEGG